MPVVNVSSLCHYPLSHLAEEILPTSPKQRNEEESEENAKEDYEEWKRKILENAQKSKKENVLETNTN